MRSGARMHRRTACGAILAGLAFACGSPPSAAPLCPTLAIVPAAKPPARSPCQIIETRQENGLAELRQAHPEYFSRKVESDEPLLGVGLFRRCQRIRSGAVGLVPIDVEPSGIVTLLAMRVDRSGKESDSPPVRVAEPQDWLLIDSEREPVVVVTLSNVSACEGGHPCSSSEAIPLRFGEPRAILAPLAERWLGTKVPIVDSDDDGPLPWWMVAIGTERGGALATIHFRWPSLRIGSRLLEGVDTSVEIDQHLEVGQSTLDSDCERVAPVKSAVWLWKSAQCERLRGSALPSVLAALRTRCEEVLSHIAQGKEDLVIGDDLCLEEADRTWLSEPAVRASRRRPAVRIAPEVTNLLTRIGPALRPAVPVGSR